MVVKKFSKKQNEANLRKDCARKAEAEKKIWLKGCRSSMEQDILSAAKKD
jgi:hypothetical protein